MERMALMELELYLIEILHQTTTIMFSVVGTRSCILSKFYIKPQPRRRRRGRHCVVSYRNSTSNHNHPQAGTEPRLVVSYRNSTSNHNGGSRYSDWLEVVSYRNSTSNHNADITSVDVSDVVSYRNSTSNHNAYQVTLANGSVVSYRNSTSNHNFGAAVKKGSGVVSYRNSTSNHNTGGSPVTPGGLYLIEILHQTTTRLSRFPCLLSCILSKFYIKPQH